MLEGEAKDGGGVDIEEESDAVWAAFRAVAMDDADALGLALQAGAPFDARLAKGASLLGMAAERGGARCCAALVSAGADPFAKEPGGSSPALMACSLEDSRVLEAMLDAGMPMGPKEACQLGAPRALELLLARGADPNGRDARGMAPLMWIKRGAGAERCVRLLVEAGAEVGLADAEGKTALMWAVPNVSRSAGAGSILAATINRIEDDASALAAALLSAGADPTVRAADGSTALDLCAAGLGGVSRTLRAGLASWEARQLDAATGAAAARREAPRM